MNYLIIGDIHGDVSIIIHIIYKLYDINLTENTENNIKELYKKDITIILLGDIFDCWHEKDDILYYEYNINNDTSYKILDYENYKLTKFENTLYFIKLLKNIFKEKLILILGNHDIRYYKKYDIFKMKNYDNTIQEEIKEYLEYIINNFELNYILDNKINFVHYKEFTNINLKDIIKLNDNDKLLNDIYYLSKLIEKNNILNISNINNLINENFYNKLLLTNKDKINNYIIFRGHLMNNDKMLNKIIINLDNRMSRFKYDYNKCNINNCLYNYVIINNNNNQYEITKIIQNKYKYSHIIYKMIITYNEYNKIINKLINFQNNIYLTEKNKITDINIYDIILNNINKLIDEYTNNIDITNNKYFNQITLNNIYNFNKKLNVYNTIINYDKIMEDIINNKKINKNFKIKYLDYIYDKNLNIIGNIKLRKEYILTDEEIKKGGELLEEIEENYNIFKNNENNKYIIGKNNYKYYIKDCITNYKYILSLFNSFDIHNEDLNFTNIEYKRIIYYIYLIFYNYKLTNKDIDDYNNNILNMNKLLYNRLYNICYIIDELEDNKKYDFRNNIIENIKNIYLSLKVDEEMINYELFILCYNIITINDYKKKQNLINILKTKLKKFNNQELEIKFLINNMINKYEDKFYDNTYELKYITQLNIYILYYIYENNIDKELQEEIKKILNL